MNFEFLGTFRHNSQPNQHRVNYFEARSSIQATRLQTKSIVVLDILQQPHQNRTATAFSPSSQTNMPFAQLVLGSPGAGKSTYCNGMQQFMSAIGRKCSIVNLDPANESTTYPCAIDVRSLVKLEDIMEEDDLGPNGAVLYALEELEHNMDWLEKGLSELGEDYVLFDCPGQVELYTHHSSLRNIFYRLQKLGYRVRVHSTSIMSMGLSLVLTRFVDGSFAFVRFLLLDSAFALYLQLDSLAESYAADGSATSECPYENRQAFHVFASTV